MKDIIRCPLCGASDYSSFESDGASPDERQRAIECMMCGLIYMNTAIEGSDIAQFWEGYEENRFTEDPISKEKRIGMYTQDYAFVQRFLPASYGDVLDIGCGEGSFLNYFASSVRKHGIEVDSHARAVAVHRGVLVYDSIARIPPAQLFDVIVFRGTLQYMPDLNEVRDFCHKHLALEGTVFVLATPNADSLLARIQREHWALFNHEGERYYFGFSQLERLFEPDLKMIAYDLPYLGTPYENYREDYQQVVRMCTDPEARKKKVPFFGSILNAVFQKQ